MTDCGQYDALRDSRVQDREYRNRVRERVAKHPEYKAYRALVRERNDLIAQSIGGSTLELELSIVELNERLGEFYSRLVSETSI